MLKGFHNFRYVDPYLHQEPHYVLCETINILTVSLLLVSPPFQATIQITNRLILTKHKYDQKYLLKFFKDGPLKKIQSSSHQDLFQLCPSIPLLHHEFKPYKMISSVFCTFYTFQAYSTYAGLFALNSLASQIPLSNLLLTL